MPAIPDEAKKKRPPSKRPKSKARKFKGRDPVLFRNPRPLLNFARRDPEIFGPDPQTGEYLIVRTIDNVDTIIERLTLEGAPVAATALPEGADVGWQRNGDGIFTAPHQEDNDLGSEEQ